MAPAKRRDPRLASRQDRHLYLADALTAIAELANGTCRAHKIFERDIDRVSQYGYKSGPAYLAAIKSARERSRLMIAFATAVARRANGTRALEFCAKNLARGLFLFQISHKLGRDTRAPMLETALQLSDGIPQPPPWLRETRTRYEALLAGGAAFQWENAIGLRTAEAEQCLLNVRRGLGLPPFRRPDIQLPVAIQQIVYDDEDLQIPVTSKLAATRIKAVEVRDFRGVAGELTLDFLDNAGSPCSCIIYGDNGVGKSTIASAIELACQGTIGSLDPNQNPLIPHAVNVAANDASASVKAIFNDEDFVIRSVRRGGVTRIEERGRTLGAFTLAPMLVQRNDITRFFGTPPAERGRLFVDHFRVDLPEGPKIEAQEALQARLGELRHKWIALSSEVAEKTNLTTPPETENQLVDTISQHYLQGMSPRGWKERTQQDLPIEAARILDDNQRITNHIQVVRKQIRAAKKKAVLPVYELQVRRLGVLLGDIGGPMSAALRRIAGSSQVSDVRVDFGRITKISIEVTMALDNGLTVAPENFFSEGIQDLVALLFFFEIAHAAATRGQARILILDDVLQSVDATIRINLMDYILERTKGWQLFFTVHDRLWREQLVGLLRQHNHAFVEREIRGWTPAGGPAVRGARHDVSAGVSDAIEHGSNAHVCSEAGRLLEHLLDTLSWTIPVSVTRRAGDRYTIGDLWPPVVKKLKKTSVARAVEDVERWLVLRNLVGAHYNSWAESLPKSDADSFGLAILELLKSVYCFECRQWPRADGYGTRWFCRCGKLTIEPAS